MTINPNFWHGKRVVVTGHTGFKGSWLSIWLQSLGADVFGISLVPDTQPSLFAEARVADNMDSRIADIRDFQAVATLLKEASPEILFHMAAQPLVRRSYESPLDTYATNVLGTAHVLEGSRKCPNLSVAVMITTDKVYSNREWHYPYREDDILGGHDPYSASKAASELVISSYRDSFLRSQGIAVSAARAGNVIGGGDWAEDRLIPDLVRCWSQGKTLHVRRPQCVRPWQHVLEPLTGYLTLAERLWSSPDLAGAYNFGPSSQDALTVQDVVSLANKHIPNGKVLFGEDQSGLHEAGLLNLDISKARATLGIQPVWNAALSIAKTCAWYTSFMEGAPARDLCLADIRAYIDALHK